MEVLISCLCASCSLQQVLACVSSTISMCISCSQNEVIAKKYGHLRKPTRNIQELSRLLQELVAKKEDVLHKHNELWHQKGMLPAKICNLWLRRVDEIVEEVSSLVQENGEHRHTIGCCFICPRIEMGELIEEKIRYIGELLANVPDRDDSIAELVTKRGDFLSATSMMEDVTTHQEILMKIWGFLFDQNVRRIGVWGIGGVGKTTIMSEINNRLLPKENQFDSIIWVKASNNPELQQEIARKLGLTFQETDNEKVRASKLFEAFNRRRRFALIFDDVWEQFSLERIGIPMPTVGNGCKLVIISRDLRICRAMETDEDVEVKVLSENEAWHLFKDKVGEKVLSFPTIELIARDVAKECGGLPLAIVAVGRALRNSTNIEEWKNALEELRTSGTDDDTVFSCLKLSYSKLRDDTRRSCFLFCALYPEGYLMDTNELVNYWRWEGLLDGSTCKSESKRKGESILFELGHACLLEINFQNGMKYVKLHDLVRDMAIKIMRTNPRCIVKAGMRQVKPPSYYEWVEDAQWVSLMRNDLKSLDINPRCRRLTSLLLQYNSFDINLSDGLFDNMQELKVLDLSYTGIRILPASLSNLENLCALFLCQCWNLIEIPSLAKLTKLKYLDFSFSRNLTKLPHGMEQLTNLRHLDFSSTSVQKLPMGLIPKFTLLEDLLIVGSPIIGASSEAVESSTSEAVESTMSEAVESSTSEAVESTMSEAVESTMSTVRIEEIISCYHLSTLHMQFLNMEAYEKFAESELFTELKEFKLVIGFSDIPKFHEKTSLAIKGLNELHLSTALIPGNSMEIIIFDSIGTVSLSDLLLRVTCLKSCEICHSAGFYCIVDRMHNNLSTLERMNLSYLKDLRMICGKPVRPCTLMNLKVINVENCPSLGSLFPWQLMGELKSLEEITIRNCISMKEIIEDEMITNADDNNHAAKVMLPKLRRLKLEDLRQLNVIYNGVIQCNSLRSIEVKGCDALRKLPLGLFGVEADQQISSSTSLEEIKGEKEWWESLEWDPPHAKRLLQPYSVERYSRDKFAPSGSGTK